MARSAFAARRAAILETKLQSPNQPPIIDATVTNQAQEDHHLPSRKRRRLDITTTKKIDESQRAISSIDASEPGTISEASNGIAQPEGISEAEQDTARSGSDEEPNLVEESHLDRSPTPSKDNLTLAWNETYSAVDIRLKTGDSVSIAGEFDLWVKKGSIRISGATIHASSKSFRIHSPITHAVPSIEALVNPFGPSVQDTEIHVSSSRSGLTGLKHCNPKFAGLRAESEATTLASFEVIRNHQQNGTSSFQASKEWRAHIAKIIDSDKFPVIMICGPKNAGKSTFARYLSNSLLSRKYAESGFAYLDLDPGQPEYTPPADLSLSHIKDFNLGPPLSHPILSHSRSGNTIRQHHYGHMSPRDELDHYLSCATDLYEHYKRGLQEAGCPLIINTCGWVQGPGIELLNSLAKRLRPSHVVAFTSPEMIEIIQLLKRQNIEILPLPALDLISGSKTSSELRSMQQCSYFHVDGEEDGHPHWSTEPILTSQSLSLAYAGNSKIISGILLTGDHVDFDMLEKAIDRTILALVAIEDPAIISMANSNAPEKRFIEDSASNMDDAGTDVENKDMYQYDEHSSDDEETISAQSGTYIISRNSHGIPFLYTQGNVNPPLDPSKTRSLGQVLLSGFDHDRQVVRVHTPVPEATIQACLDQGQSLILVRGQLGMPEWAYLEGMYRTKSFQKELDQIQSFGISPDVERPDFDLVQWAERTPYVEHLDAERSRKVNKVRRVRRNLNRR